MMNIKYKLLPTFALTTAACFMLMGCDILPKQDEEDIQAIAEASPDKIPSGGGNKSIAANDQGATPMIERIAVLGLLNKRTGDSQEVRMNPDQSLRIGNAVIIVQACERTAPWETYPDIGAFVQLLVNERPPGTNQDIRWRKVFSGWLHKNNPAQNVVEHGLYDVWVKDCIMLFPGESESPPNDLSSLDAQIEDDSSPSSAPQSPRRAVAPAAAEPSPAPNAPEAPAANEEEEAEAPATEQ